MSEEKSIPDGYVQVHVDDIEKVLSNYVSNLSLVKNYSYDFFDWVIGRIRVRDIRLEGTEFEYPKYGGNIFRWLARKPVEKPTSVEVVDFIYEKFGDDFVFGDSIVKNHVILTAPEELIPPYFKSLFFFYIDYPSGENFEECADTRKIKKRLENLMSEAQKNGNSYVYINSTMSYFMKINEEVHGPELYGYG